MHLPLPHTKNICQFISSKIEENICENVFEDIGLGRKKRFQIGLISLIWPHRANSGVHELTWELPAQP